MPPSFLSANFELALREYLKWINLRILNAPQVPRIIYTECKEHLRDLFNEYKLEPNF